MSSTVVTPKQPASLVQLAFLAAPLVAHTLLTWTWFQQDRYFEFQSFDLLVFCAVIAYALLALWAASSRRVASRLLLVFYSSLVALALANGVIALRLPMPPERIPHEPRVMTGEIGKHIAGLEGTTYTFTVNSLGLRGPEVDLEEMDLNILCVGGSTTECVVIPDEKTWPWRLQDKLARRLRKKVFVGNAGKSGQFTLHHAYQLEHYPLVTSFDWVVVMCGINDFGRSRDQSNYEAEKAKVPEEALTPSYQYRSYYWQLASIRLLRRAWLYWGDSRTVVQDGHGDWIQKQREKRQEAIKAGRVNDELDPEETQKACDTYRENLLAIINTAREKGVNLVMVTQPTLYRKDLPDDLHKLIFVTGSDGYAPSLSYQERGMRAYNQTMMDLCAKEGIPCIDLDAQLPKDGTIFFDDCHFTIDGCDQVAGILANFFVKELRKK